jgi:AcrR family transcriptional regulator
MSNRRSRAVLSIVVSAPVARHTDSMTTPAVTRTARELAREHVMTAIVASARTQLTEVGAAELSLRAVARELGMASSAVYRYVASRDELLTALLVQVYSELGAAAEAAEDRSAAASPHERWVAVCHAVRRWALDHPHDYALLYGTPVIGYAAPQDTVAASGRVTGVFARLIGSMPPPSPDDAAHDPSPALAGMRSYAPGVSDPVLVRAMLAWTAAFGTISFELWGHLVGAVDDADEYADLAFRRLATDLGLPTQRP